MTSACDKCGTDVPRENDAAILDLSIPGNLSAIFASSRHLFPVQQDGVLVCEGSPSRAQYLDDTVRDSRSEYSYNPANEAAYRAAYEKMRATLASS